MKVQNYLTDARIKDTIRPRSKLDLPFEYHEGLYDLIPSFTRALEYFKSDEVKLESNYYFKIKKTCLELQHYEKLHQNKNNSAFLTKELKSFAAKMEELSE
jgi:DNA mismatch repair ATPase MutS